MDFACCRTFAIRFHSGAPLRYLSQRDAKADERLRSPPLGTACRRENLRRAHNQAWSETASAKAQAGDRSRDEGSTRTASERLQVRLRLHASARSDKASWALGTGGTDQPDTEKDQDSSRCRPARFASYFSDRGWRVHGPLYVAVCRRTR